MNEKDVEEVWGGVDGVMDDPDEQRVLFAALDSFFQYAKVAHYNTTHVRRQSFYALPQAHWQLLASPPFSYLDTLIAIDDGIDANAKLAAAILSSGLSSFGYSPVTSDYASSPWHGVASQADLDKARSTLRQFYRDWSSEGEPERKACYGPIIADLHEERRARKEAGMSVLVPGAGLGRLVFELCNDGFDVEGNEISYHQLLASSYILNECPRTDAHTIYPWIHSFSNHARRQNQLQAVHVPDVHPGTQLERDSSPADGSDSHSSPGQMSMSASDFLCLYGGKGHAERYDAVATSFFLDTAPNPIRYIETVRRCLKQGGLWTNVGPLLWHFENSPPGQHGRDASSSRPAETDGIADPGSVELTNDEVIALVERFGFRVEKQEFGLETGYIQDPRSMLQNTYRVAHWTARKI